MKLKIFLFSFFLFSFILGADNVLNIDIGGIADTNSNAVKNNILFIEFSPVMMIHQLMERHLDLANQKIRLHRYHLFQILHHLE